METTNTHITEVFRILDSRARAHIYIYMGNAFIYTRETKTKTIRK